MAIEQLNNEEVLAFNTVPEITDQDAWNINLDNALKEVEDLAGWKTIVEEGKRVKFSHPEDLKVYMTNNLQKWIKQKAFDNVENKRASKILEKITSADKIVFDQYPPNTTINIAGWFLRFSTYTLKKNWTYVVDERFALNFDREKPSITYLDKNDWKWLDISPDEVNKLFQ